MKKLVNTALAYAIAAMAGGVFYREFTKFNGFTDKTSLLFLHPHLFVLGSFFFLLILLLSVPFPILAQKRYPSFCLIYHTGMAVTALTFLVRGVTQVLGTVLSRGMDAALSGVAGIGHILIGVGLVLFLLLLKKAVAVTPQKLPL